MLLFVGVKMWVCVIGGLEMWIFCVGVGHHEGEALRSVLCLCLSALIFNKEHFSCWKSLASLVSYSISIP